MTERYVVWNNKGGVGKSTITFHVASRYAELNPEKQVLVIDLCPQANASMMLLGGGVDGENHVMNLCTQAVPRTVVGYMSTVIASGAGAMLPNPYEFLVPVDSVNPAMPSNLALLCGDGNLEPMAPAVSGAANAPSLTPMIQPWKWVHLIFRGLIDSFAKSLEGQELVVFIDTNPSFSIYTELAISAGDKLIVPVNADDSSRVAANALFILLHGQNPPHPIYGAWTYATKAQAFSMLVPKIHVIVGNRLTQYDGAAGAFSALSDATADTLFHAYTNHPGYFTPRSYQAQNLTDFRSQYSVALRDFNTAGIVAAHLGKPLTKLNGGYHYVHGNRIQINTDRVAECLKAVDLLVASL
ncbi:ParA family protein [Xanthomonas oryzae]|uniref:ParA family protein n=1 Tax=Xanthomonas oryzae TaxID=347 RepID=UPI00059B133E|nr:ParA family protein [Xanthomonas oryzae]AKO19803.1 ATPase [Xanthomonas oryzae pv. oryzicola]PUE98245.1 ParA family protein [Xanthomonas oryzae pv. oryzicola]WVN08283.1 ParA family protein [Xanthomonas oryzae pv. oryzicola]